MTPTFTSEEIVRDRLKYARLQAEYTDIPLQLWLELPSHAQRSLVDCATERKRWAAQTRWKLENPEAYKAYRQAAQKRRRAAHPKDPKKASQKLLKEANPEAYEAERKAAKKASQKLWKANNPATAQASARKSNRKHRAKQKAEAETHALALNVHDR